MLIWYLSNRQTTQHAIQARMTSQVVNIFGIYDIYSVCFGIDVCDVKRPKASHNATNGSMVTSAITFNRIGSNKIGFGSNLILMVLFQGFANVGLRG